MPHAASGGDWTSTDPGLRPRELRWCECSGYSAVRKWCTAPGDAPASHHQSNEEYSAALSYFGFKYYVAQRTFTASRSLR
mmetsp:Transcript_79000/g.132428  ORF Transcript_79000/g.132428 Transcript_79000/m.132428 type:complete len:80 (-) Transcript_79000:122-361(-)